MEKKIDIISYDFHFVNNLISKQVRAHLFAHS